MGARAVWEVVEVECVAQCADRQSVWGKALDRQLSKISGGGQTALSVTLSEGNFSRIRLFWNLNFFLVPDHVFSIIFLGEDFEAKPLPERFSIISRYECYHRVNR